jgi:hypothetical protein
MKKGFRIFTTTNTVHRTAYPIHLPINPIGSRGLDEQSGSCFWSWQELRRLLSFERATKGRQQHISDIKHNIII